MAAVPWAILTSALEWFILVPLFPFWQPIFTLQQPYWIGFLVHLSSASRCSPGFVARLQNERHSGAEHFSGFGALALFLEFWCLRPPRCSPHTIANCHGSGATRSSTRPSCGICPPIMIKGSCWPRLRVERASDPHLRALSKLMAASQRGEAKIFARWWASWFGEPMQICSAEERASMPGLLETADVAKLGSAEASSFDRLFVDLMTKSWRMRSVMNSKGRSRSCAAWTAEPQSATPFETRSPTTSIPSGMKRFIGTPVERIIACMNGSAPVGA